MASFGKVYREAQRRERSLEAADFQQLARGIETEGVKIQRQTKDLVGVVDRLSNWSHSLYRAGRAQNMDPQTMSRIETATGLANDALAGIQKANAALIQFQNIIYKARSRAKRGQ